MSSFERIEFIKQKLLKNGSISFEDVREKFDISKRTFYRDLNEIKKILNTGNIKYLKDKDKYELCEKVNIEDLEYYDEKNILFYTFLESIVSGHKYIPFYVDKSLEKIKNNIDKRYLKLLSKIKYQEEENPDINLEFFKNFIDGLRDKKRLKMEYENSKGNISERIVEPQYCINYSSQWYFICYDCNNNELRMFNAGRIKNLFLTDENCKNYIKENDLKKYIESGFGIYKDSYTQKVTIRFYEPIYHIVKHQRWHKDEEKIEGVHPESGKYVELKIPVASYEEITGKILRYLPYAEAIEPEDFRNFWLNKIEEGAKKFLKKF